MKNINIKAIKAFESISESSLLDIKKEGELITKKLMRDAL